MRTPAADSSRAFLVASALTLILVGTAILAPFLSALLAAASVSLLLAPAYRFSLERAPKRPTAVAVAMTALMSLLMAIPLFLAGWAILDEAAGAYPAVLSWLEGLSKSPSLGRVGAVDMARGYAATLKISPRAILLENLDQISSWAGHFARALIRDAVFVILNLAVFAAALFLFLRDGPSLIRRASALIPLPQEKKERLFARVRGALLAVVNGIFVVALVQGTLAWVGLALFRVPFAILLGALCAVFSPLPFIGSALVWTPIALYTLLSGATAKAAAITLWFVLIVGLSDNLVRPILLGTQMKLPIPLIFIAVVGALKVFGLAGLFLGPLVVALAIGVLDVIQEGADGT